FYNYCLSMVLLLWVVGFCVRRRELMSREAALLCLLFLGVWFTHLLGFLLGVCAAFWLVGLMGQGRLRMLWVAIAAAPVVWLTLAYFHRTEFFAAGGARPIADHLQTWSRPSSWAANLAREAEALPTQLFAPHEAAAEALTLIALGLCAMFLVAGLAEDRQTPGLRRWPLLAFAAASAVAYVIVPDHLDPGHGGFLKSRLAPLPLLFALLACR